MKNLDDIYEILSEHKPDILCLQETHLNAKQTHFLTQYRVFRKDRDGCTHSSGGVALVVQKSIACHKISLQTNLEAVAMRAIVFDRLTTVCSLYIPPDHHLQANELESLVDELPYPFILMGDFNAHHQLWGSARVDARGRLLEKFLLSSGNCLFNKKHPTYYNTTHNTYSAIDLAIGSPTLFPLVEWSVIPNPYGSDHFPITLRSINSPTIPIHTQRFREEVADWKKFREMSQMSYASIEEIDIEQATNIITAHIIGAAHSAIPQTSGRNNKPRPWWNEECKVARKQQNKAWAALRRYPTTENLVAFKRAKAKGRRIRREAKTNSWKTFLSSINSYTDTKKVWKRISALQGRQTSTIPLVSTTGDTLEDQANALGQHFESVSSSAHYTAQFLQHKLLMERQPLRKKKADRMGYNCPFTKHEFAVALSTCGKSAPGPDKITYEMLKHVHPNTQDAILFLFNKIWQAGRLPKSWKESIVVGILKEGKDTSLPSSYRPIALTSCLCKLFEKMINRRLIYFLEHNGILDSSQAGFRSGRCTTDALVAFESYVRDAFVHKQHCITIFFDLEKAYDTTWRYGILLDLCSFGVCGNMLNVIEDYLTHRTFRVRIGHVLSRVFTQENGVPQGGVLSCSLFIVKMNSLKNILPRSLFYSVYVDDVQISFKSCNMAICERQIQLGVNRLSGWANENGFKFNCEKSSCVVFSKLRGMREEPCVTLEGKPIPVEKEHKFLGVLLDEKLSFIPHIKKLRIKCMKALNILKILSHQSYGTDRECLLSIFNSLVRSRIDYGSPVYQSAPKSALKLLDPVYHLGLRLATGAFRTSPIESLYVESDMWSLDSQRAYTALLYAVKTTSIIKHPSNILIHDTSTVSLFLKRPSLPQPYAITVNTIASNINISFKDTYKTTFTDVTAPWKLSPVVCDMSFRNIDKANAPTALIHQHFFSLQHKYHCTEFYTDASKTNSTVSCAVCGPNLSASKTLNPDCSIFTGETHGILMAVEYIIQQEIARSVIYTDSLSVVTALSSAKPHKNAVFNFLLNTIMAAYSMGLEITVCWIPGHCGIPGNEAADREAAAATLRNKVDITSVPYPDLKPVVKRKLRELWQKHWDSQTENKLHVIKPRIGRYRTEKRNRLIEVTFCRLRIGHTYGTHSYLLNGTLRPQCARCGQVLSVLHVLAECTKYDPERRKHFPELYTHHIPLHPSHFLADEPMFAYNRVLEYLFNVGFLQAISYRP